jgi:hypothetical protein
MTAGDTAQAEPGNDWNVEGTTVTNDLTAQLQVTELVEELGTLSTKVGLTKVEVICAEAKLVEGRLLGAGKATGRLHLAGCATMLNGNTANACTPRSPEATEGLIETNPLEALIASHEGSLEVIEVAPQEGSVIVPLVLGSGECAIGKNVDVSGQVFLADADEEAEIEKVSHSFEEGPLGSLKFGANAATVDGVAVLALAGEHEGMKWSAQTG